MEPSFLLLPCYRSRGCQAQTEVHEVLFSCKKTFGAMMVMPNWVVQRIYAVSILELFKTHRYYMVISNLLWLTLLWAEELNFAISHGGTDRVHSSNIVIWRRKTSPLWKNKTVFVKYFKISLWISMPMEIIELFSFMPSSAVVNSLL